MCNSGLAVMYRDACRIWNYVEAVAESTDFLYTKRLSQSFYKGIKLLSSDLARLFTFTSQNFCGPSRLIMHKRDQ